MQKEYQVLTKLSNSNCWNVTQIWKQTKLLYIFISFLNKLLQEPARKKHIIFFIQNIFLFPFNLIILKRKMPENNPTNVIWNSFWTTVNNTQVKISHYTRYTQVKICIRNCSIFNISRVIAPGCTEIAILDHHNSLNIANMVLKFCELIEKEKSENLNLKWFYRQYLQAYCYFGTLVQIGLYRNCNFETIITLLILQIWV